MIKAFVKIGFDENKNEEDFKRLHENFTPYIWGKNGIIDLAKIDFSKYCCGVDILLVKYFVCPTEREIRNIKGVGPIDSKKKIIDVSIIVDDKNFFSKNEKARRKYLVDSLINSILDLSKKVEVLNIQELINKIKNLDSI